MQTALLIVDVQNDFCPGGALGVKEGDAVVPIINQLKGKFSLILASKDWHPEKTPHFDKWPPHCIRASRGAEFHPDLDISSVDLILLKGTGATDDGYSAFEATNADLASLLRQRSVTNLFLAGLTTEYCIKSTAIDSIKMGFNTYVIQDAIKPVNMQEGDEEKALKEMRKDGVKFISSREVAQYLS